MLKEWTYPLVRCASISRVIRSADGICGNQLLSLSSNESLPRSTNCISTVVSIAVVMLPVMVVHVRRGGHAGHRLPERTGHHRVAVAPDAHDRRAHLVPLERGPNQGGSPGVRPGPVPGAAHLALCRLQIRVDSASDLQ